ncbi:MAG: exodeoxyribonuclease VII large subunit [Parvibaculum sp.]|nr:exodeoxyribonuclease VII large subunit [Parvibaculum sp.]
MASPESPAAGASNNAHEFSVSEISFALKKAVEEGFGHVRVRGEITGYRGPHSSGHCYFGLKDERARIDAVIWRGVFGKLRFKPEEGMEVVATGKLTTYPGSSRYQIVIEHLEPAGVGALMALLEERRKKFEAEGLFASERKRPLPYLPDVIGVITSPTGAVIRDILHRLQDRFPRRVIVWPVRVQGETSAAEVAAAINGFNAMVEDGSVARPDVLIVARGGGSIEDLWSFNEEIVVRAAAASAIPLISAVGHETDTTLIDFASDRRAPTPTAAAEIAVPVRADLIADVADKATRLRRSATRVIETCRQQLRGLARGLPRLQDLVALPRQRFDAAADRLGRALIRAAEVKGAALTRVEGRLSERPIRLRIMNERKALPKLFDRLTQAENRRIADVGRKLDSAAKLLESYSYQGVLKRGYAVVRDEAGVPVRRGAAQKAGARLEIEFAEDRLGVLVAPGGTVAQTSLPARKPEPGKKGGGEQGTLL